MNFKNCENNDLRKHISKLEAQLSAVKSYVNCEVSILTNKIENISNEFEKKINTLLGKENNKLEILQQNMTLLKNEFMYRESVLCTMPKNTSTSENYCPTQRQSLHHLQPQSEQRDVYVHSRFQQS